MSLEEYEYLLKAQEEDIRRAKMVIKAEYGPKLAELKSRAMRERQNQQWDIFYRFLRWQGNLLSDWDNCYYDYSDTTRLWLDPERLEIPGIGEVDAWLAMQGAKRGPWNTVQLLMQRPSQISPNPNTIYCADIYGYKDRPARSDGEWYITKPFLWSLEHGWKCPKLELKSKWSLQPDSYSFKHPDSKPKH